MKTVIYQANYDGKIINVPITFKRQKNIYLRHSSKGYFCTAPTFSSKKCIFKFIDESLPKLEKRINKNNHREAPSGIDYTYLLGEKVNFIDKNTLYEIAKTMLTRFTREYEKIMGITDPYKIKIKETKSRYGSNSKTTHTISYQLDLIHYSEDIIKSVVIHELAHNFVRNHQKAFYNVVYKYCPNYNILRKKLIKGIYQ